MKMATDLTGDHLNLAACDVIEAARHFSEQPLPASLRDSTTLVVATTVGGTWIELLLPLGNALAPVGFVVPADDEAKTLTDAAPALAAVLLSALPPPTRGLIAAARLAGAVLLLAISPPGGLSLALRHGNRLAVLATQSPKIIFDLRGIPHETRPGTRSSAGADRRQPQPFGCAT